MPSTRTLRQQFITSHCDIAQRRVLEIGALDAPTFPDDERIKYLDWFDTDELRAHLTGNPNRAPERVVDVSYVVQDKRFSASIPDRFDVVIANHVIEHIADPITWLEQLDEITVPDGMLFLAVPDRRYTFDYLRPESTAVDLLRAREDDLSKPDFWQVLAALYYYRPVRAEDFWGDGRNDLAQKLRLKRFPLDEAIITAKRHSRGYADVHCSVFSCDTFAALCEALREANLTTWVVRDLSPVHEGHQEFHVCLVKRRSVDT